MKFRPLHDRVVVRRIGEEAKTAGGIIIPDTAQEKPQEGEVVAVGPGVRSDDGTVHPLDVKPGDRVATQVDKTPEAIMLYLGCLRVGAVYLPLNVGYTETEIEYVLGDASEDETEIRKDQGAGGEGRQKHSPGDTPAYWSTTSMSPMTSRRPKKPSPTKLLQTKKLKTSR